MSTVSLRKSQKLNWRQVVIGFATLVIIIIAVFRIGGDDFVYAFNNNISSFQALAILILCILILVKTNPKSKNYQLWFGLTVGWLLWTIAEFWWGISSFLIDEPPFPSAADFFWMIGYIPMFLALNMRNRSIPKELTESQRVIILLSGIAAIGLTTLFILMPSISYFESENLLVTIITMFYPVADVILLTLVLRITFKYQQGVFGRSWLWILAGYVLLTFADLIYCYASANDLYYPSGEMNFISTIGSDLLYSISYMVIMYGLAITRLINIYKKPASTPIFTVEPVSNTHILFFTNRNNLINDVSNNFSSVFNSESTLGYSISKTTGIPIEKYNEIISKIKTQRILDEESVVLTTRFGSKKAQLSGEVIMTPEDGYSGAILLIRLFLDDSSIDASLSDFQKSIIQALMKKTGSKEENEIKKMLTAYCSTLVNDLLHIVASEGGNLTGHSVSGKLLDSATVSGWKIKIAPDGILDTDELSLEETKRNLPEVVKKTKQITSEFTDEATIKKIENEVWLKMDKGVRESLMNSGIIPPSV